MGTVMEAQLKEHPVGLPMGTVVSREVRLKEYPVGLPTKNHFEIATAQLPPPRRGQCLVRNIWMSVDPYMRGRMRPGHYFVPPFEPGKPLEGACVGQVVASDKGPFEIGDYVLGEMGWREYWLTDGQGVHKIDPSLAPVQTYLGALGMTGMTAYVGLVRIGQIVPGETVFVSGAAGAVGNIACQIAKIKGCQVVASAGSDEKIAWLKEHAQIDRGINYKKAPRLSEAIREACPDGINIYFDNVGGDHLEAALQNMANFGRIVACGMISSYNQESPPPGPPSIFRVVTSRLRMEGFIVFDHLDLRPAFLSDMSGWLREGLVESKETIWEGLDKAPAAFVGLFRGDNTGKMLVKIGPAPAVRA